MATPGERVRENPDNREVVLAAVQQDGFALQRRFLT